MKVYQYIKTDFIQNILHMGERTLNTIMHIVLKFEIHVNIYSNIIIDFDVKCQWPVLKRLHRYYYIPILKLFRCTFYVRLYFAIKS